MEENNKLIAEFMGWIRRPLPVYMKGEEIWMGPGGATTKGSCGILGEECFHYSWDWLMPVVERIESLGYGVTIGMGTYCIIQNDWKEDLEEIYSMTDNNKLFCTYNAVVKFIKWYNINKS